MSIEGDESQIDDLHVEIAQLEAKIAASPWRSMNRVDGAGLVVEVRDVAG